MINLSSQILLLVVTFLMMWAISPLVAGVALFAIPVALLFAWIFGTVGRKIMLSTRRVYGKVSGQIAENLSGIHVAKAFNREEETAKTLKGLNAQVYKYGYKFMSLITLLHPLIQTFGFAFVAIILFLSASLVVGGISAVTIGEVLLGTILMQRFLRPMIFMTMQITSLQNSMASMDRLFDVLDTKPTVVESPIAIKLQPESDGISFSDVVFAYEEGKPVLKNVNFTIPAGKTVAVVGHTGAGKTTIAGLINRFFDPQKGSVLIGEQNIKEITLASLHDSLSLIPQEPYLFDGTVTENICYGKSDATQEEITEITRLIGADEFIEALPDGYDTHIIESGKNLSAGQRQMITIARTMLANPKILILDEATSRLDAYSESLVQSAQEQLFSGRTTMVIAHRLTTIANAAYILVFDHGELVEEGTHEELLASEGTYKGLYDMFYAHQGVEELQEETVKSAQKIQVPQPEDADAALLAQLPDHVKKMMEEQGLTLEDIKEMRKKMQASGMNPPH
jgi:ATP-binding cassette subfamily B protein